MKVIHCGVSYECSVAVKCEADKFIKLYDEYGTEIAAFIGITDFSLFEISGGSFIPPYDCEMPISLNPYSIGGRTITTYDWTYSEALGKYYYEIVNGLISNNETTCNILLLFKQDTELEFEAKQESGKVVLFVDAAPLADIVIESIKITRV